VGICFARLLFPIAFHPIRLLMSSAATARSGSIFSAQHTMLTLDLFTPNDDARPVFLTGTFNAWVTRDDRFKLLKIKDGHYQVTFNEVPQTGEPFEYEYVKGGWEAEELGQDGYPPVNRRMEVPRGKVADVVPRWKQHTAGYDPQFYPEIQIVAK